MSRQLPELYLRGSLINKTMKNLTPEQMETVNQKIEELLKNPSLSKCKEAICNALANTIKNDYAEDKQAGLQEYRIALMRAVVYAMFHKPNPQVFTDPIQTRKFFSHMAYNYMRQILNENKIPHSSNEFVIQGPPSHIVFKHMCHILEQNNIKYSYDIGDDTTIIYGDVYVIDLKTSKQIGKLKKKYMDHGVEITTTPNSIAIHKVFESPEIDLRLKKLYRVKSVSFESDSDKEDNHNVRYAMEYNILQSNDAPKVKDIVDMGHSLPQDLKKIFDLIINTPDDFTNKYGTIEPSKKQMAQYLNVGVKEIEEGMNKLKYHYIMHKMD